VVGDSESGGGRRKMHTKGRKIHTISAADKTKNTTQQLLVLVALICDHSRALVCACVRLCAPTCASHLFR
jgi:hypothetical protein